MTNRQKDIIRNNLHAFVANFGDVRIEDADYGGGFYVYYPPSNESYIQYCENIHYLDGWLYGAVQAVHQIVPLKERFKLHTEMDE